MPSAFAQEKSTCYELSAINFHLGETPPRERKGRGRNNGHQARGSREPALASHDVKQPPLKERDANLLAWRQYVVKGVV
jgi:hypothetical protein